MQHPDRLVAFFHVLKERFPELQIGDVVDEAATVNLTTLPSINKDFTAPDGQDHDPDYARQIEYHEWGYNLTGASANARRAVSQLSDEHVEEVANTVAERVAASEAEL